jgi:RND family efflux transporter MFP subunit
MMSERSLSRAVAAFALWALSSVGLGGEGGFDCMIEPARVVKVASPVRGILKGVEVERGDPVSRGQVIARLESSVEAATVALARIRASDDALVGVEQEKLALRRKTYDRGMTLRKTNAISQQQMDEYLAEYRVQQQEVARAEVERELAAAELERSRAALDLRNIRSLEDGVITERAMSGGEFVQEDSHIVTLVVLHPLHVETFLPTELYTGITAGQRAIVEPEPPFEGRFPATVVVVDPVFDAASGTFGVRLELPNEDRGLPAGLRCRLRFLPPGEDAG